MLVSIFPTSFGNMFFLPPFFFRKFGWAVANGNSNGYRFFYLPWLGGSPNPWWKNGVFWTKNCGGCFFFWKVRRNCDVFFSIPFFSVKDMLLPASSIRDLLIPPIGGHLSPEKVHLWVQTRSLWRTWYMLLYFPHCFTINDTSPLDHQPADHRHISDQIL